MQITSSEEDEKSDVSSESEDDVSPLDENRKKLVKPSMAAMIHSENFARSIWLASLHSMIRHETRTRITKSNTAGCPACSFLVSNASCMH